MSVTPRTALALVLTMLPSCRGDPTPPPRPAFDIVVPRNLPPLPSPPARNPTTVPGVELGKRLFFDARLSGNDTFSCATCHDPQRSFSDGKPRSIGSSGVSLPRHTPALINVAWMSAFFWDGGAKELESQVFGPLTSPDEMAQDVHELVEELEADPTYREQFSRAFDDGISMPNIVRALAQYERTLVNADSRYDRHVRGEAGGTFDFREQRGLQLFRRHCSSCHATDLFTDGDYHNNGLDSTYDDAHEQLAWGRARITRDPQDMGKYKTPSLRNVAMTAPYMHDGRFDTLERVLQHYRFEIKASATLDPRLRGSPAGIALCDEDAASLVAFLHTLTDVTVASDHTVHIPSSR